MLGLGLTAQSVPVMGKTLVQRALAILRRFGSDAHVYLPGIGTLSGLQAANYLDSVGTTLATVDSPVGLVLDAMGSVGVELVTNGDFSAGATGWTVEGGAAPYNVTFSGGAAVFAGSASFVNVKNTFAATAGKTYLVSYSVVSRSAGSCRLTVGGVAGTTRSAAGNYSEYLVAISTGFALVQDTSGTFVGSVDNISVREVTGIHATQPTTAAKPRLERGVRNLLTYSQDFSNAAWTKTGSSFSGGKLQEDASVSGHTAAQAFTPTAGTTYTAAIALKAAERGFALFGINGGGVAAAFASVNLSTGAMSVATGSPLNLTSVYTSDGYWLVTASIAAVSTASMPVDVRVSTDGVWANRVYQGVAGSGVLIQGSALFQGTLTAAQILDNGGIPLTTTAAASNPNAGKYSWAFDGGDSLALGSVPFQMSDDHAVILSCSMDNPGAEYGAALGFVSGTTAVLATLVNAAGSLQFRYKNDAATTFSMILDAAYTPSTRLVASVRNISGTVVARKNGVQAGSASPTGVFTLTGAFIGVNPLGGSSLKGSTGPILAIKGTLTDGEMLTLERLVANFTPNAPQF